MASLGDLIVRVGADLEGFEKAMGTVSQNLSRISRDADKAFSGFSKMGSQLASFGASITAAVTLPIAAAGAAATKFAADFELGMRQVTSLMGSVSPEKFEELSAATLELSRRLGIDAVKATQALYEAISAGVPEENALSFLEVASKAAIAGVTDTKVAVDGMTNIINAFGMEMSQAQEVSDAMFQSVNVGKFTFEQLSASVGIASGTAAQMGVNFKELLASAASITKQGFSVSEAFTNLQSVMTALIKPNEKMVELLEKTGFASGEALLKTKGLQGAIQTLDTAAQHNSGTLAEAFGRVEALKGSLALTGKNAAGAAKDLDSITNSAGAANKAFEEIDKTTARQFEKLTNELKGTAIELGTALLPAVNNLLKASKPLIDFLASGVKWFSELSPTVQTFALAVAGAAAAIGPLLIGFGSMLTVVGQLGTAWKTMSGLMGIAIQGIQTLLPALASQLGIATQGMLAFGPATLGAATAAKVFSVAIQAIPWAALAVGAYMAIDAINDWRKAQKDSEAAGTTLNQGLEKLAKTLIDKGVPGVFALRDAYLLHKITLTEYQQKLRDLVVANTNVTEEQKKGTAEIGKAKTAGEQLIKTQEQQKKSTEAAAKSAKDLADAYGKLGLKDLNKESKDLAAALDTLKQSGDFAKLSAQDQAAAVKKVEEAQFAASGSTKDFSVKIAKMTTDLAAAGRQATTLADVELQNLENALRGTFSPEVSAGIQAIFDQIDAGRGAANQAALEAGKLEAAYKNLGITSAADLKEAANQAAASYETIKTSATATYEDILAAEKKALETSIAAQKAAGDGVIAEDERRLKQLEGQTEKSTQKQVESWSNFGRQVSTIVTDAGKSIAEGLLSLFDDSENQKLTDQSATLTAELQKLTGEYQQHVADVSAELAGIPAAYSAALGVLEGDLSESLDKIDADNAKKLGAMQGDYDRYIKDVIANFDKLQEDNRDKLEDQLEDLRDSLEDRRRAYDRSVADADRSYRRDRENLQERLDDSGRDYRQYVEDQQLKLKELEGDESDSAKRRRAEIHLSLQHRLEDYNDTQEDIRLAMAREEEDLKLSLQRKAEDWNREKMEIAARQDELQANYKKNLDEQNAALQQKLTDRKTIYDTERTEALSAYETQKNDAVAKFEEQKQKIGATFEGQTAKLNEELDKARTAYDTYKTDIETKLGDLEEAHKGPLERIGAMFKGVFDTATESLLRFLGEEAMGALFKQLGNLLDNVLPSLNKALGGILGAGGSAAGSAASAAGGAGQAAGSVSGAGGAAGSVAGAGISGIAGIVTGAVSAVTGVIGAFQMQGMNKSLDVIVQHTLQTANDLANLRRDEWDRETHLLEKLDDIWRTIGEGFGNAYTRAGEMWTSIRESWTTQQASLMVLEQIRDDARFRAAATREFTITFSGGTSLEQSIAENIIGQLRAQGAFTA